MGELGREIKRVDEEVPNLLPEKQPEETPAPQPEREKVKVPVR
jgi:hypothetical protein